MFVLEIKQFSIKSIFAEMNTQDLHSATMCDCSLVEQFIEQLELKLRNHSTIPLLVNPAIWKLFSTG